MKNSSHDQIKADTANNLGGFGSPKSVSHRSCHSSLKATLLQCYNCLIGTEPQSTNFIKTVIAKYVHFKYCLTMISEIDRKIAVILVADVVGYSKHMERDENTTLKAYAECEKILKTCLKKYKGSIFNTAGDSALAEFPKCH
jgi:hypothetical protein